jgi:hypothetical protein
MSSALGRQCGSTPPLADQLVDLTAAPCDQLQVSREAHHLPQSLKSRAGPEILGARDEIKTRGLLYSLHSTTVYWKTDLHLFQLRSLTMFILVENPSSLLLKKLCYNLYMLYSRVNAHIVEEVSYYWWSDSKLLLLGFSSSKATTANSSFGFV